MQSAEKGGRPTGKRNELENSIHEIGMHLTRPDGIQTQGSAALKCSLSLSSPPGIAQCTCCLAGQTRDSSTRGRVGQPKLSSSTTRTDECVKLCIMGHLLRVSPASRKGPWFRGAHLKQNDHVCMRPCDFLERGPSSRDLLL